MVKWYKNRTECKKDFMQNVKKLIFYKYYIKTKYLQQGNEIVNILQYNIKAYEMFL